LKRKNNIITALDIGTTKVCAMVGEVKEDKGIRIIGLGNAPSTGLRKGAVVNIEETVESIKKAVEEAKLTSGVDIKSVYTGIAGSHISGYNSRGVVAVQDGEVNSTHIERVIESAKALPKQPDREILHVIPRQFILDGQEGIKNPLGMSGVRLEVEVHIITGAINPIQNVIKSVKRAGLEVADIFLQPLASSEAVLETEEKDLGVVLVDIGGGTTDVAVFIKGAIAHTAIIGIGGNHITSDIAIGLRTPLPEAEKLKIHHGCAMASLIDDPESFIQIPSTGGRPPRNIPRQAMAEIIEPRVEEIFKYVMDEIVNVQDANLISSGVVITGGSSMMEGMVEICERITGLPVRRGMPENIEGPVDETLSHPMYSTSIGIIMCASQIFPQEIGTNGNIFSRVIKKIKTILGFF